MKSIALGYLGLDEETIENVDAAKKDDVEAYNREIIKIWQYGNSGHNQKKVCMPLKTHCDDPPPTILQ